MEAEEYVLESRPSSGGELDKAKAVMLDFIGSDGRYQFLVYICSIVSLFVCPFPVTLISFVAPDPNAECLHADTGKWESCSESDACSKLATNTGRIDFTFDCWTKKYNMICDKASHRRFANSMFILMSTLWTLFPLLLADIVGRKPIFLLVSVYASGGVLGTYFIEDFFWKIVLLGISSAACPVLTSLFIMTMSECSKENSKLYQYVVVAMFIGFPIGTAAFCLITYLTIDSDHLALITMISMTIGCMIPVFFVHESPTFLLEKLHLTALYKNVKEIRKQNKLPADPAKLQQLESEIAQYEKAVKYSLTKRDTGSRFTDTKKRSALLTILSTPVYLYRVIALSTFGGLLGSIFVGASINLSGLGSSDIRVNGVVFSMVEVVGTLCVLKHAGTMKRRFWGLVGQGTILLLAVILGILCLVLDPDSFLDQFMRVALGAGAIGGVMYALYSPFYYYISELFPVELRGTGNSLVLFVGNLITIATPYLMSMSDELGLHPLIGCSAIALVSIPLTFFLKETV